jgi:tetrahydromethanopterin S-methyltransferase subunit G
LAERGVDVGELQGRIDEIVERIDEVVDEVLNRI